MSQATAKALPTRSASRSMNAPNPIVSSRRPGAAESGGSVRGTSAVHNRTATIASPASRPTISAIATEETMGEDAAIRTNARSG